MANKFETVKATKDGLAVKAELDQLVATGWQAMDKDDLEHRLKWIGIFYRKRTPGQFMLRLRIPNGLLNSNQLFFLASVIFPYGQDGVADITTRQNLQLRGLPLEAMPEILKGLERVGLTSVQSGMDNVRNITGSPLAGVDPEEVIDTRGLTRQVQDMITNCGRGNFDFTNLPRKFNIAIEGGRDNSVHAEINDLAFVPAFKEGQLGFNVLVGGFFSAKRCAETLSLNAWVPPEGVVDLCRAVLNLYRDQGLRLNRQKSRLMWLIEAWGLETFRAEVEKQLGSPLIEAATTTEITEDKRDLIGILPQKQFGLKSVGLLVPAGRLRPQDMVDLAQLADRYGNGEIRLTVEQNVILTHVPETRVSALLSEPLLQKFRPDPGPLRRGLVSCTGNQFCSFALIETKNRAVQLVEALEAELDVPQRVRIHWSGCPNSCGQPQVAEIGLMGTTVRKDGKPVEAVDIFMGGEVGQDAKLGSCVRQGIPCGDLKPVLRELLIEHFGAKPKTPVISGI